jgi:hypothetical protein
MFGTAEKDSSKSFVLNPRLIAFDEHGNLRYGAPERDRNAELVKVLGTDTNHFNEEGKDWYILDSTWVHSWLLYVYLDVDNAPGPGPCRNDRLLEMPAPGDYLPPSKVRRDLVMATARRAGDYRRVCKETWDAFQELYPGSGPEIVAKFPSIVAATPEAKERFKVGETEKIGAELGLQADGRYDTSSWVVTYSRKDSQRFLNFEAVFKDAVNQVGRFFVDLGQTIEQNANTFGARLGEQTEASINNTAKAFRRASAITGAAGGSSAETSSPSSSAAAAAAAAATSATTSSKPDLDCTPERDVSRAYPSPNRPQNQSQSQSQNQGTPVTVLSSSRSPMQGKGQARRNEQFFDEFFHDRNDDEGEGVQLGEVYPRPATGSIVGGMIPPTMPADAKA